MFVGNYEHTIDEKNRLAIPSKWRVSLEKDGKELYITRGLEQCIFIFSSRQFEETKQKIRQLPFTNKKVRSFSRIFFSNTSQLELDKQGRILIPQSLKDFAEIDKEVVLVGVDTRGEIWNPKNWESFYSQEEKSFEENAENIHD